MGESVQSESGTCPTVRIPDAASAAFGLVFVVFAVLADLVMGFSYIWQSVGRALRPAVIGDCSVFRGQKQGQHAPGQGGAGRVFGPKLVVRPVKIDLEPDRGTLKEGDVSTMESRAATLTNGSVDQSIASSGIHISV